MTPRASWQPAGSAAVCAVAGASRRAVSRGCAAQPCGDAEPTAREGQPEQTWSGCRVGLPTWPPPAARRRAAAGRAAAPARRPWAPAAGAPGRRPRPRGPAAPSAAHTRPPWPPATGPRPPCRPPVCNLTSAQQCSPEGPSVPDGRCLSSARAASLAACNCGPACRSIRPCLHGYLDLAQWGSPALSRHDMRTGASGQHASRALAA